MFKYAAGMGLSFFLILQIWLAGAVSYLLFLTGLAARASRTSPGRNGPPSYRFAILIPAHNESGLLPGLLQNLAAVDYPRELIHIHVVADNCTDDTAEQARHGGALVHERHNLEQVGKGYALQWLGERLATAENAGELEPVDAFLLLDADSLISPNFLRVMDARLAAGERVIQAYYTVRDPESSWSAGIRYAALAALHYLRPAGRSQFGGSAGLKGNGMVFAAPLLRRHQWTASLTEDIELHMALLLEGEPVTFAPDAIVWAEMPDTLAAAETQNVRWEQGRLEMVRRYVPRLLLAAARQPQHAPLLLDAVVEHLIPPLSILAASSLMVSLVSWLWPQRNHRRTLGRLLSVLTLGGQAVYVLAGLHLAGASRASFRALLFSPIYLFWKLLLYGRLLLGKGASGWERTSRNQ
jgi:cellulose synthase/poly-beta-1,6-N-acetylglucosamine synthase-like glycosyltransferase